MVEKAIIIVLHRAELLKSHIIQLLVRLPVQGVHDLKLIDVPRKSHTSSKLSRVLEPHISRLGLIETIAELTLNAPVVKLTALGVNVAGSLDDLGFNLSVVSSLSSLVEAL